MTLRFSERKMRDKAQKVLCVNDDLGPDYELDQVMVQLAGFVIELVERIDRMRDNEKIPLLPEWEKP